MLDIATLQAKAVEMLSAASGLATVQIFVDDGLVDDRKEAALRNDGIAIVVRQPGQFTAEAQAHNYAFGWCETIVHAILLPEVNDALAVPWDLNAVGLTIRQTLQANDTDAGQSPFRFQAMVLTRDDAGVLEWEMTFNSPVTA
jgi:glutaminase